VPYFSFRGYTTQGFFVDFRRIFAELRRLDRGPALPKLQQRFTNKEDNFNKIEAPKMTATACSQTGRLAPAPSMRLTKELESSDVHRALAAQMEMGEPIAMRLERASNSTAFLQKARANLEKLLTQTAGKIRQANRAVRRLDLPPPERMGFEGDFHPLEHLLRIED
jgi:hypothetical protein